MNLDAALAKVATQFHGVARITDDHIEVVVNSTVAAALNELRRALADPADGQWSIPCGCTYQPGIDMPISECAKHATDPNLPHEKKVQQQ